MSVCTEKKVEVKKKRELSTFSKYYLALYNGVQTVGWSYVLFQSLKYLAKNLSTVGLWDSYGTELLVFQSLATLEVLHCMLGLVPANAVVTGMQVASRVIQAWGIIYTIPEIQDAPTVAVVMVAWGIAETCRYSYYLLNLTGQSSSVMTWCRYSLFYGLYPAGVFGEVTNIILALKYIRQRQVYSIMLPNPLNISFSYYYANIFLIMTYFPLFPQLYNHMRHQRSKILGSKKYVENGTTSVKKVV